MKLRGLLTLICIPLLVSACAFVPQQSLKIGFSACLSGLDSELGINGMYGAMLKIDEINADGGIKGRRLELLSKDDKDDPDQAVLMDQEMQEEGVTAVIGHMESGTISKSVKWAAENKLLYISPTVSSEAYSGLDDWMFRVITANSQQSTALDDMMFEAGIKKVAVLWDNTNKGYSDTVKDYFIRQASKNGTEIIHDVSFNMAEKPDYPGILDGVRSSGAEALLLIASSAETALLLENLSVKEFGIPCYMTGWSIGTDLLSQAGDNLENTFLVTQMNLLADGSKYLDFVRRFREKYGTEPNAGAILSYDAMSVLVEVLHLAPDTKPDTLKATLLKIRTFEGLQSPIIFDDYGDVHRPIYKFIVKDGAYVPLP